MAAMVNMAAVLPNTGHAAEKMLPVTEQWQETSQWCWAASGQMIMEYLGTSATPPRATPQCYQANQRFGRTDCCTCPTPAYVSAANPGCVRPGWPQLDTWGYNSSETTWGTALAWDQVKAEIEAGRPFMLSWAWHGGGAHAMVGIGYREKMMLYRSAFLKSAGKSGLSEALKKLWPADIKLLTFKWVMINNPWPPQGRCGTGENASGPFGGDFDVVTYAEFVGGTAFDHDHGADIYNVKHK
jgi:hypothetical protein